MKKNGLDLNENQNDKVDKPKELPLSKMTSAQLDEYAKNNNIDISEAKNKNEKLAIIREQIGE